MSEETFTTCIHLAGEDYDDVTVELYCEPSDIECGVFHPTTEVETITHNGVDITSLATKADLADLCDEFNRKMAAQMESAECDRGDWLYDQMKDDEMGER